MTIRTFNTSIAATVVLGLCLSAGAASAQTGTDAMGKTSTMSSDTMKMENMKTSSAKTEGMKMGSTKANCMHKADMEKNSMKKAEMKRHCDMMK